MTTEKPDVIVIGAGIVGLCVGLNCLKSGHRTLILDGMKPGTGASFGNGGMLSVDSFSPMAMPGMIWNVPGWLMNPIGPLALRPSYLPRSLPWLMRWLKASSRSSVQVASQALRALNSRSIDFYRDLLGESEFSRLIRTKGSMQVWDTPVVSPSQQLVGALRSEFGIPSQDLTGDECRELIPQLSPAISRGIYFPRNGHIVSPAALTETLARIFVEAGGAIRAERVMTLLPNADGGATLMTSTDNHSAPHVVVAAGAFSNRVLEQVGCRIPLETERGYHVNVKAPFDIAMPLLYPDKGFGVTPMLEGLRVGGTVEIAGLDAPPKMERAKALIAHARALFPKDDIEPGRLWMGFRPSVPRSVPIIDEVPSCRGLYVATGHGHYGMIAAPATGKLMADIVARRAPTIDRSQYRIAAA
ncbi:NAD(P)/FAD-dependent oxidoreductase [Azospirillum picis]|uniref:D-amino-acid dehydrogenase n=1 Tax=Azospirillum picis TaxID=488438 RepID=A0ABU0MHT0_9PROT|nr:FAD-dependent oxidoreductase [Azospirillum picis]MBP2298819.1 D-amino-acid dehydrogenase [Azospirillum picis]MDQ0532939.1 D-amino-acid dehydrogenase [Azospirillum picis]